ncbi:hypothetical protein HDV03_000401 [Kappamyces sp. JEL0829]|nr:hypothetical protein HDV03_000401 [Kappamyces sp. JEL0829]
MLQDTGAADAEFELLQKFLVVIAKKDYATAQPIADQLLKLNPANALMQEYRVVLAQRVQQLNDEEEESETEDEESQDSEASSDESADD